MKKAIKKMALLFGVAGLTLVSCSDFEEINVNPNAVTEDLVRGEFLLLSSINGVQQNPHISERVFVLYWKAASRFDRINTLPIGGDNSGWTNDYYGALSGWLKNANLAIQVVENQIESGDLEPYSQNLIEVARIWRGYIISEFADNFGPGPITGFDGENPDYVSVEEMYDYILSELADASSSLDTSIDASEISDWDPAYGYDFEKWVKYANSLRMRLAMRLSEVAPAKAQQEFEAAASGGNFISSAADNFAVNEAGGWNDLTSVMSRQWNNQYMSPTYRYLTMGLGGVASADQLAAELHGYIKGANDLGVRFEDHLGVNGSDPTQGFWLDGVPNTIDPRAYVTFALPGDEGNPDFNRYPTWAPPVETEISFTIGEQDSEENGEDDDIEADAAFSFNAFPIGDGGTVTGGIVARTSGVSPRLVDQYRNDQGTRVMFGSWETHFLLAEAHVRGWNVPLDSKTAYEQGIADSFEYFGVSNHLSAYLASEDYNGAGTSVRWEHTTEPPASVAMDFVDGYTGLAGVHTYEYPSNTIYEGGAIKNDWLNKIMTQKFIAQTPYLPLEVWSDHRRLGLPFFENPAAENPLPNNPGLSSGPVNGNTISIFPQRLRYPPRVLNDTPATYEQAVQLLGGADEIFTPLWWAQQD
ncbi:MAG: SusD/RagB family nutrient-binding outer membrane lipoprotein [Bacteroidota bacterium]